MRARVVVVGCSFGDASDFLRVRVFSSGGEHGEVLEDVVLGVAADPGSALLINFFRWDEGVELDGESYRMSLKTAVIILCSAWRTAMSRPFASQEHWSMAGRLQIAQSGSIVLVRRLDLLRSISVTAGR